ncbi:UNVERIFIED_CONTAM: Retrovirus-related Pol polyprotein from transposon TNT 1-94 [Sesamum angustifolium]|uniref:Retrovirus-related Pol polyprotein from transposon TNT 1-94 n=1 Tax=Sesamum angustifolium TaxID=2727405 RepID=A0AAW2LE14_9LAMI
MKIWLTMKGLLTVIQVTRPEPTDTDPKTAEIAQWTERDQIGRGAILSALSNTLFDVYCSDSYTAKSLWDELDRKYNTEEQGLEKYSVSKFMRYQMVEDRSVAEQTHEIINLEHALADAEMKLPEKFLVGHWAKLCPNKKAKTGQAVVNMVVGGSSGASTSGATEGYVSVQPELLTIYEPCDWLIDTGANVHVCADKSLFVSYQAITGKTVSMGNSSTAKVLGIGSVDLKFPSGRILSLKRVHHVPTVRRNIISGSKFQALVNTIVEFRDAVFLEDVFPMKTGIPSSVSLDDSLASTSIPEHVEKMTNPSCGELEEEIYMDQPEGFVAHGNERKVCKLVKSLYGLKQAPKQWHEKFDQTILAFGFTILEKFGYQNSRIAKTPYDSSVALFKNESGVSVAQLRYTSCPDKTHWGALDRVLRYLKGTVSLAIHYGRFPAVLEGYSASWIAKTPGVMGVQAELCALDTTGTEAEWLFGLLSQLPIVSQPLPPIAVHCDSQTTIAKVRSRKYNQKTKRHIQVRLKSIRALVSDRVIGIDFVGTKDNVADPLTKGLDLSQVNNQIGDGTENPSMITTMANPTY